MRPGTGRAAVSLLPGDDRSEKLHHKLWHKVDGTTCGILDGV